MDHPASIDLPDVTAAPLANCPPRLSRWRRYLGLEDLSEAQLRRARAAYFGLITFVDDQVGAVLKELELLGLEKETFVIYLSDHGEMAGEHGLWSKSVFFDGAARVPLIMSCPARLPQDRAIAAPVELVDIFPTLAGLLGHDALPEELDGRSLLPLMSGARSHKDAIFSEQFGNYAPSAQRMIRTQEWKFNLYDGEPGELYDMRNDPFERDNLAKDPGHQRIVRELQSEIAGEFAGKQRSEEIHHLLAGNRTVDAGFNYSGTNRIEASLLVGPAPPV